MDKKTKQILFGKFSYKRLIRSTLLILILSYTGLIILGYFRSDSIIFPIPQASYRDNNRIYKITLPDQTRISATEYSVKKPDFHIIYNHGNGVDLGVLENHLKTASERLNCSITAYDYPGYGTSQGKPTESSVFATADAVYTNLKSKGVKNSKIIIWGRSVGSGPAAYLAQKYPAAGLILESPFKSAFTVLTRIPIVPFDKFDNISRIDKIDSPFLIIHGTNDQIIPFSHSKELYKAAEEPKSKLWIKNAGHNNLAEVGGNAYWNTIRQWILHIKETKK